MVEIAFTVAKGTDFYNQFFRARDEKQKFHDLAREFFKKHDLMDGPCQYYQCRTLAIEMDEAQKLRFYSQIRKNCDLNNITFFKKKSQMQIAWTQEVVEKVDMNLLDQQSLWYWPYIGCGEYALWCDHDEIYGLLKDRKQTEIQKADWMLPIKMSEYYAAMERLEAGKKLLKKDLSNRA